MATMISKPYLREGTRLGPFPVSNWLHEGPHTKPQSLEREGRVVEGRVEHGTIQEAL